MCSQQVTESERQTIAVNVSGAEKEDNDVISKSVSLLEKGCSVLRTK